jgi:hypothetical protein
MLDEVEQLLQGVTAFLVTNTESFKRSEWPEEDFRDVWEPLSYEIEQFRGKIAGRFRLKLNDVAMRRLREMWGGICRDVDGFIDAVEEAMVVDECRTTEIFKEDEPGDSLFCEMHCFASGCHAVYGFLREIVPMTEAESRGFLDSVVMVVMEDGTIGQSK